MDIIILIIDIIIITRHFLPHGFFANFMNESTNFQVPRSLALTPPPHSSHDYLYLPNLNLSVGMDLDS